MSMAKENIGVKGSKPQGKRKIAIEKIVDKAKKQVTFSKRRKGIFKKASELCALCNVEIAVLTFSAAGKVFPFGHPSVESTINRYIYGSSSLLDSSKDINQQIYKERLNATKYNKNNDANLLWLDRPIEGLGLDELEQYMASLKELRNNVASKIGKNLWKKNDGALTLDYHQYDLDLNKTYLPLSNEKI